MTVRRNVLRVAIAAGTIGVLGGAVAAVAIPDDAPPASAKPSVRRAPVERVAAARPEPSAPGTVRLRVIDRPTIAVRVADPAGGPDWAVRVFEADRTFRDRRTRPSRIRVAGRSRCVQLGRIHRGRFGWLDGTGSFRPTRPSLFGGPAHCGSRREDLGREPFVEGFHPTVGLGSPSAQLASTVVWGIAGPAARRVQLRVAGASLRPERGAAGAFLAVGDHRLDAGRTSAVVDYPTGPAVDTAAPHREDWAGLPAAVRQRIERAQRQAAPSPSTETKVVARAADPNGGLPYGLAAAEGQSGWCVGNPGRVIDDRVGSVDFRRGTFTEIRPSWRSCLGFGPLSRRVPVGIARGGADLGQEPMWVEDDPVPGRVARRTLPGLTWLAGRARDDVRSVTLRSPRDVRTLVPDGDAHVFLVVYDGSFPAGRLETTATFADGKTARDSTPLGF